MANNETQTYSGLFVQYNDSKEFLMESQKSNHSFAPQDFKYIVQLAYPIVFVEVEVLERTMEDFPIVEKTVLKFIRDGFMDPSIIAKVLGLTESYIRKIMKLLLGYGHIDDKGITSLGLESISIDASIKKNTVKQRIQIDGVTAEPIYVKEFISNQSLRTPKASGLFVAHMEPVEGVEKSHLMKRIKDNYTDYVDKGEYSLHTNVEEVNYAKFIDLKYAKAYYLEDSEGNSVIMCKTYNSTSKEIKDRFGWKPLFASNSDIALKYGFSDYVANHKNYVVATVNELKYRLEEKRNKSDKEVSDMLGQLYPFNWKSTELIRADFTTLTVSKNSFKTYDKFVLKLLESFADDGFDNIILEEMYGERIIVDTKDKELMDIAKKYKKKIEDVGRNPIMNAMENASSKGKEGLFTTLKKVMNDLENDR